MYYNHIKRTQIYITMEQAVRIRDIARDRGVSQAHVIRKMLDDALETGDPEAEARAAIMAMAGVLAGAHDRPEWQARTRGRSADERLRDHGL